MLACTMCGRTQREVAALIAGPTVYICDACVRLAADVLAGMAVSASPGPSGPAQAEECTYCGEKRGGRRRLVVWADDRAICSPCVEECVEILAKIARARN
jgi:ATP-dependent protease Clp ATPase subunit